METILVVSLIGVAFVAGFIGLNILGKKQAQKREAELAAWAQERGWQFSAEDKTLLQRWPVAPFTTGQRYKPSVKDVLWGPTVSPQGQTRQALSFTYRFETKSGSGEDRETTVYPHHVTCVFLGYSTPVLEVSPEGIGARISKALGGQDIQFESEAFNKKWRVESQDLKFAHAIINPQMMEHLMHPHFGGVSFAYAGGCILVFNNRVLETATIDPMLAICHDLIDRVPAYVLDDLP